VVIPSNLGEYAVTAIGGASNGIEQESIFGFPNTSITSVEIPSSVTSIGFRAFYFCLSLIEVTIPSSVTSIGDSAFEKCRILPSITIPNNVTSIGHRAFYFCDKLTSINIPDSVNSIGGAAFFRCSSLANIIIGKNVSSIGELAFAFCTKLENITIPSSIISIGNSAFSGCSASMIVSLPLRFNGSYTVLSLLETQVSFYGNSADVAAVSDISFTAGQQSILSSPNSHSLYTANQMQTMAFGDLVLTKNANGSFVLNYDIEQSTDLQNWTTYQAYTLPLTGLPIDKAFVRIKMINSAPNPSPSTAAGSNIN
jgi:hypothetical protein